MPTAFVLSGGGSLGAVQVGMIRALAENGVEPDLLIGTSAGALNAAFVAGHGVGARALDDLAASWVAVRRRKLFPLGLLHLARAATATSALCPDSGIRALVRHHLTFGQLEDAPIPLAVVATDLLSGEEVVMDDGDALSAVVASAALPGVFPVVCREGKNLADGGLANNTAISQAVSRGADLIVVLPAGYACALPHPPRSPVGAAIQAISLLTQQRLVADIERYAGRRDVLVVPTPCPLTISPIDFDHARTLIALGHEQAARWITSGGLDRPLETGHITMHRHDAAPTATATGAAATGDKPGTKL